MLAGGDRLFGGKAAASALTPKQNFNRRKIFLAWHRVLIGISASEI